MKDKKWDEYFYSHYKPERKEWGREDLIKYRRWYSAWIHFIKERFSLSFTSKTALELGCGIGSLVTLLDDEKCRVTGSDIAEIMVDHAKKLSPTLPFLVYDAMEPFPKQQTFDYVIAFEVLEHIPKLDNTLKNIYELVRTHGYFIGSSPYPYPKNMIDPTHVNVHLPSYWKTIFRTTGFSSVETVPLSFPPLLWRIPPFINPIINTYIPYPGFVSTTLIVARK